MLELTTSIDVAGLEEADPQPTEDQWQDVPGGGQAPMTPPPILAAPELPTVETPPDDIVNETFLDMGSLERERDYNSLAEWGVASLLMEATGLHVGQLVMIKRLENFLGGLKVEFQKTLEIPDQNSSADSLQVKHFKIPRDTWPGPRNPGQVSRDI